MLHLEIRVHHLLCLLGFRGLGYGDEFVANMKRVASATFFSPNTLKIVDHCDSICSACPYQKGDECRKEKDSAQQVKSRDRELAAKLGVQTGISLSWQEVRELIRQKIAPADLVEICRECEWLKLGYCVDSIKKLHQDPAGGFLSAQLEG